LTFTLPFSEEPFNFPSPRVCEFFFSENNDFFSLCVYWRYLLSLKSVVFFCLDSRFISSSFPQESTPSGHRVKEAFLPSFLVRPTFFLFSKELFSLFKGLFPPCDPAYHHPLVCLYVDFRRSSSHHVHAAAPLGKISSPEEMFMKTRFFADAPFNATHSGRLREGSGKGSRRGRPLEESASTATRGSCVQTHVLEPLPLPEDSRSTPFPGRSLWALMWSVMVRKFPPPPGRGRTLYDLASGSPPLLGGGNRSFPTGTYRKSPTFDGDPPR